MVRNHNWTGDGDGGPTPIGANNYVTPAYANCSGEEAVCGCLSVCLSLGGPGKAVGLQCVCLCVFGW